METIKFYSITDEFGYFSNFSYHEIHLDNEQWKTVEHYFQAQKFTKKEYRKKIKQANSPMLAAILGRSRKQKLRKDWDSIKIQVMRKALHAKFSQHRELKDLLLSTGNAKLVESTLNDSFWGDGGNGKGKNMLGQLLMELRQNIYENEKIEE